MRVGESRGWAYFALLSTATLWASAFPAIRVALPEYGPSNLAVARLVVASIALLLAAPVLGIRRPGVRDLPLIGAGAVATAGYQFLLNWGEVHASSGTASLMVATAPIYTAILAAFLLRERVTRRRAAGMAIAFLGTAVIAWAQGGATIDLTALVLLGAAIAQGAYMAVSKPLTARYRGPEVACYTIWGATLMLIPLSPNAFTAMRDASWSATTAVLLLGVGASAIAYMTWGYAVAKLDASLASMALYLVPAIAIAVAYVWLGERPGAIELLGGAVIMAGVLMAMTRPRKT
ncbi:membrane protein [Longimycelium tulufanense]|uniref:Membrane protein n=2 Tax=Longimycelium tulufanense TaxID=907463 RepID=A0A8J3FW89_9PSEU|nr:membrane protein [Longimycelium tulufanense]